MKELKIYLSKDKKNEIKDNIKFEEVVAGEVTKKKIYLLNAIQYPLNVEITLSGKDVEISKTINQLNPGKIKEVEFVFTPKLTIMKPVTADLKIKLDYLIN